MTQTSTEKRPPFKWLIPVQTNGKGSFGRPELVRACRGSEDMAIELNYFAYEASSEAQNKNIDVEQVDYIRITRSQDAIMQGILHCVSKKTHIDHRRKFEEWGFLVADVYHQTYDIYFKKIAEAIENPPALEKRKPRGKHAKRVKTTNSDVKTTKSQFDPSNLPNCSFNPYEEIVKLQNQIVNLQNEFSDLQNQIVNLQNAKSYQGAPQASSEVFENPLDSNRLLEILRDKYTVVLQNDDAFTLPVLEVATAVTDTTFKIAVLDDWRETHTNQPELSTPIVDKSSVDPLATSNPIASDTPQPPHNENGSQSELIARPEKPEMPPTSMKLSAEKIVQITEALRGKYYPPEQRAKQLIAAKKIIAKNVNEEQYITAYQDRNDEWWKSTKGPLHVVHMAGKTTAGEMRVLEVLEQVQERISAKVVQFPGRSRSTGPVDSSYHPELDTPEIQAAREAKNQAMIEKQRAMPELRRQRQEALEAKLKIQKQQERERKAANL